LLPTAKAKGIDLTVGIDDVIREKMIGDAHYLGRVLMNVAGNAVKFTDKGSVAVRFRLQEDQADNYLIRFEVRDTGIGIPKELHEQIFDPFVQGSTGTARRYGGTGLGMSIAKEIVTLMGGKIMLDSEPGKGSMFYFDLVFPKGASATYEEKPAENVQASYGKRILVADDNATNLLLIQQLLQKDRHLVTTAGSGQEACTALANVDYDVIFLDFNMGDMDGAAVLRTYHRETANPAAAYFLTADATEATAALLMESGAFDVLHKPVSIKQLRAAVARACALGRVSA
jgi:two-component system sensor histidine kinase RpfC